MASLAQFSVLRTSVTTILVLSALTVLFLMYYKSSPSQKCHPSPIHWAKLSKEASSDDMSGVSPEVKQTSKPVLLLWFWPENKKFHLKSCEKFFQIDDCILTDDRTLESKAQGVLVFHRAISEDLSNLPTTRTKFQRWIWFNTDSPSHTQRIPGLQGLFNLTMTHRKDADIQIRWHVTARKSIHKEFVLPKKERLLCWIVDNEAMNKSGDGYNYFIKLSKHIKVDIYDRSSDEVKGKSYFSVISGCKFYLSFENSIHRDYITETFTGPLAAGTVPIALGPTRRNYENFAPGSSFIHVNDFSDAQALAEFLLHLDKDNEAYMRYFDWWKFYYLRQQFNEEKHEFVNAICQACRYLGLRKEYRYVPDLYKWFLE